MFIANFGAVEVQALQVDHQSQCFKVHGLQEVAVGEIQFRQPLGGGAEGSQDLPSGRVAVAEPQTRQIVTAMNEEVD